MAHAAAAAASAASLLGLLFAASLVVPSRAVPSPQRRPSASSPGRWRMLGASCDADRDCAVPYSRCVAGVCACQAYYARYNESRCLPSTLLGFECMVREQCSLKVANSSCIHGLCRCEPGFLQFRRHTCLSPARPGDVCYSDAHCRLWDSNSHCHFLIPKLFGRCGCNVHMVPRGSLCVPSQEEEFPPQVPADPSTRHPPTAATTTTTAPTTTKAKPPSTTTTTTTTTSFTPTTDGITTPAASTTQGQEATSTTSGANEDWSSAAPSSQFTESLAVSFGTSESAPEATSESDVSIKYPVPSSYPTSSTEDPYRDVTAEVEAETSPLMADATSPPVSSTQSPEPEVLSSSASPVEATENILSSESTVETSSQSEPADDQSDTIASSTTQSPNPDASTYSSPEAQSTTPNSEPYSEESVDTSSPVIPDFFDNQASDTTGDATFVSSHPPPFSVGTELTFDVNYATSTDNQPSLSIDDTWISSSSSYSDPVATTTQASLYSEPVTTTTQASPISESVTTTQASPYSEPVTTQVSPISVATTTQASPYSELVTTQASPISESVTTTTQSSPYSESVATTTQDTPVSTDDGRISSSASSDPIVATSEGTEAVTNDAEVASPSTEMATPTQETAGASSAELNLQDDTEDMSEESITEGVEPSDSTDNQPTSQGAPAASESVPPSSSSSVPLVQVTTAEKHSTEEDMMLAATSFATGLWPSSVSLGLPCVSDLQCQAADPHSRCVDRACDCAHKPNGTASCWAGNRGCHPSTFQCRGSGACISWFFVCDGRRDCADGSDEECAASPGGGCPPLAFPCSDRGGCVSRAARCDGNADCPLGEDERGCHDRTACPQFTFACSGGGNVSCLPDYELCNAVVSCADGSDEPQWCRVPPPGAATGGPSHRLRMRVRVRPFPRTGPRCPFRCDNGRCRSTAILCSGRDGCGDASDEAHCSVCKCAPASD